MRDYEELVKRLRNCVSDTVEDCVGCPYQGGYKGTYCMNGLVTEAADAITELVSNADKFKWISTAERQPEKSGLYLTYNPRRSFMTMHYSAKNKAWNAFDYEDEPRYALEVTHWMPISEPPKEVQE